MPNPAPKRLLEQGRLAFHRLDQPSCPFVVVSMFTASHRKHADRLRKSLIKQKLNYAIYETPSVHASISTKGNDDLRFCKPSFILAILDALQCPVLYVDTDVVFESFPEQIVDAVDQKADFAVFNWLASDFAYVYVPSVELTKDQKIFHLGAGVYRNSTDQVLASGMTQFYNDTPRARALLHAWRSQIERYPRVADDELLDAAFNKTVSEKPNSIWLDAEYCRYPFFIFTKPIIDHPDRPADYSYARSYEAATGADRYDVAKTTPKSPPPVPSGLHIDALNRLVFDRNGLLVGPLEREVFIQTDQDKKARVPQGGLPPSNS